MYKCYFRFYEELNDFLPPKRKKVRFEFVFTDRASVKDMIESLGVPHTEIDLILINGVSKSFSYIVSAEDDISVYPVFESLDITDLQHLRPQPLRKPKFVLDVHLGKLARYMRMAGFDSLYRNNFEDKELVEISLKEKRAILTRDLGILKRNEVTHGYFLRNTNAEKQLFEVIRRFDLRNNIKEFSRCMECNSILEHVNKEKFLDLIPTKVKEFHDEFYYCSLCNKIYWKGSHFNNMRNILNKI